VTACSFPQYTMSICLLISQTVSFNLCTARSVIQYTLSICILQSVHCPFCHSVHFVYLSPSICALPIHIEHFCHSIRLPAQTELSVQPSKFARRPRPPPRGVCVLGGGGHPGQVCQRLVVARLAGVQLKVIVVFIIVLVHMLCDVIACKCCHTTKMRILFIAANVPMSSFACQIGPSVSYWFQWWSVAGHAGARLSAGSTTGHDWQSTQVVSGALCLALSKRILFFQNLCQSLKLSLVHY
jgi:hypothetical protein